MSVPEQPGAERSNQTGYPGLIDTLGNGFALLNRRPYLVWLPIVLDLLLWTGFRVSVIEPSSWLIGRLDAAPAALAEVSGILQNVLSETELVHLVSALTPTLMTNLGVANVPRLDVLTEMATAGNIGLLVLLLGVIAMVIIGVSYLTMMGRLVIDRPAWGFGFVRDCLINAWRLAGVVAAVSGFLALLYVPFAVLGAGLNLVGFDVSTALKVVGLMMVLWAIVFFIFSAHAIAVNRAGTFDAMRASYGLVHRHLLSVIALLLMVLVIRIGTPLALQVFTETQWGVPFAIVVNAYVVSGLVTATMLYFRDRSRDLFTTPADARMAGTRS